MKFNIDLPADYANSSAPFVLFHPPEPDATSVDWRMKDGTWQRTEGPDQTRREGTITTIRGRNLGAYARQNAEEGRSWQWLPMHDFLAQMGAEAKESGEARIIALEAELQALRGGLMIVHGEVAKLVGEVRS